MHIKNILKNYTNVNYTNILTPPLPLPLPLPPLLPHQNICWNWGTIRGGTDAKPVITSRGVEYLTFFHSVGFISSRLIKTYTIGGCRC